MKKLSNLFFQSLVCIGLAGLGLYSYLTEQNRCTALKMRLPKMAKEIETLNQGNAQLQYQITRFESPENLLQLAQASTHAHLKFPFDQDVLTVKAGLALQWPGAEETPVSSKPKATVAIGAIPDASER